MTIELPSFHFQSTNVLQRQHKSILYKTKNVLFKKQTAKLDLSVLKERKQDCTHVCDRCVIYHNHTPILWICGSTGNP